MKSNRNKIFERIGNCLLIVMCLLMILVLFGQSNFYMRVVLLVIAALYWVCKIASYILSKKLNANEVGEKQEEQRKIMTEEEKLVATVLPSDVNASILAQEKAMNAYKEAMFMYSGLASILKEEPAEAKSLGITPEYIKKSEENVQAKKEAYEAIANKTKMLQQALQRKKDICSDMLNMVNSKGK